MALHCNSCIDISKLVLYTSQSDGTRTPDLCSLRNATNFKHLHYLCEKT